MYKIFKIFTSLSSWVVLWTAATGLIVSYQPLVLAQASDQLSLELQPPANQETRLEVSLTRRQVIVYRGAVEVKKYPLGIGKAGWETPTGSFKVVQMVRDPIWMNPLTGQIVPAGDAANPLGSHWIGFSTEGRIWYGFHSTNQPQTVGQAISHGCLRMYSQDAKELFSQVTVGTLVTIVQ